MAGQAPALHSDGPLRWRLSEGSCHPHAVPTPTSLILGTRRFHGPAFHPAAQNLEGATVVEFMDSVKWGEGAVRKNVASLRGLAPQPTSAVVL